ncbi:MAG TPA: sialidase family protein [Planctomycetota bacterium]|nr:sialidase family protein [Planctomycetota bacterium]
MIRRAVAAFLLAAASPWLASAQESRAALEKRGLVLPFGDEPVSQPSIARYAIWSTKALEAGPRPAQPTALHVVGQRGAQIVYASSPEGSRRFGSAQVLFSVEGAAQHRRGPRAAATGNDVVVTAPDGRDGGRIVAMASHDGGCTWDSAIVINREIPLAAPGYHDSIVTTSGAFVVAWLSSTKGKLGIHLSRSTDAGRTWSAPSRIDEDAPGEPCPSPISITAGPIDRVVVLHRRAVKRTRDLQLSYSLDAGKTFGAPERADATEGETDECPAEEGVVSHADDFLMNPCKPVVGRGCSPALQCIEWQTWFARIESNDRLAIRWHAKGGPLRDVALPPALANARVSNVMAALGRTSLEVWFAFEMRDERGPRVGLWQGWEGQ